MLRAGAGEGRQGAHANSWAGPETEPSMIRAESQDVPDDVLAFFRSDDPDRDSNRFWTLLQHWYQDKETKLWRASWHAFVFPAPGIFVGTVATHFGEATFSGDADFSNVTFIGDALFGGGGFSGDADFSKATFGRHASFRNTTFAGRADFSDATFAGEADFSDATFTEDAQFGARVSRNAYFWNVIFSGDADFSKATFGGDANFEQTTFSGGASFGGKRPLVRGADAHFGATFSQYAYFGNATFSHDADFRNATFAGDTYIDGTSFSGDADFSNATFSKLAHFGDATFAGGASFGSTSFSGEADFSDVVFAQKTLFRLLNLSDQSRLMFRGCSLANVEFRSVDLRALGSGVIRFADAIDIERVTLRDVKWPDNGSRPTTADEADLSDPHEWQKPSAEEVERVYRGLRKNHEDRGDRVGAHGWYFSEMEIGRAHAKLLSRRTAIKRVSRGFYKTTSNYGLSALRRTIWLAIAIVVALYLFSLGPGWCPARLAVDPATKVCVGLRDRLQVALLAIFLQAPPSGIVLSGVLGQIVWLVLRVTGAAMLLSIGIAFRNQVAR
jgi:hypothetical protein